MNKAATRAAKAMKAVAAAYRSSLSGGDYGAIISAKAASEASKALADAYGASLKRGDYSQAIAEKASKASHKRTAQENAARQRVLRLLQSGAAKAARLTNGKKKPKKPSARKASSPKPKTVTAEQVIQAAAQLAMKRWLCEGARRSGCGAGGSRVVTGKGSFVRLRPPRHMTSG